MRTRGAVVVIVGASSGIGRATALAFAERGAAAVVLAARNEEALEEVATGCRDRGAQALVVPTEVTDADAVTAYAPFLELPLSDFQRVLDVNIMGCVHGARAALPRMHAQGSGRLINIASVLGVVPQPYGHPYSMSKAAVRMLGAGLRQELQLAGIQNVHVCTVLPAAMDTPFFQHAANYTGRQVKALPPVYPPELVARTILELVRRPRREVPVGGIARTLSRQSKIAPDRTERMLAQQVEKTNLSRTKPAPADSGILYEPEPGPGSITGGWHGRTKTGLRRAATWAPAGGTVVAVGRWLTRPVADTSTP